MSELNKELQALFAVVDEGQEKVAEEGQVTEEVESDETIEKIAEDLYAGGEIMANAFVDRALEKLAGSGVPAAGGGMGDPIAKPRSRWEEVAARLAKMHGRRLAPGDDTSVRAEDAGYPGGGHNTGKGGDLKYSNTAKPLG